MHESNGIWFCYDFHGSFSAATAGEALEKMNTAIDTGAQALAESDCVIITLGTAWVYELKALAGSWPTATNSLRPDLCAAGWASTR